MGVPHLRAIMDMHDVWVKWAPGHMGIEGNEAADKEADKRAIEADQDDGLSDQPMLSGIGTVMRRLRDTGLPVLGSHL